MLCVCYVRVCVCVCALHVVCVFELVYKTINSVLYYAEVQSIQGLFISVKTIKLAQFN